MNYPIARQNGLVVQEMLDEVLVYDLDTNRAHCLNLSAGFIWKACDGKNSIGDIVRHFEQDGNGKVTEDFVWLAIDQLSENGLLSTAVRPRFARQSRRQALKRIGLLSAVALPVIASIVAPPRSLGAVSACVCQSNAQCVTQPQPVCGLTCGINGICVT